MVTSSNVRRTWVLLIVPYGYLVHKLTLHVPCLAGKTEKIPNDIEKLVHRLHFKYGKKQGIKRKHSEQNNVFTTTTPFYLVQLSVTAVVCNFQSFLWESFWNEAERYRVSERYWKGADKRQKTNVRVAPNKEISVFYTQDEKIQKGRVSCSGLKN